MRERERRKLEADLSAYLDGELSPERMRAVERLLAESEEARQLLDDLRDVSDQLAALPRRAAPDALTAAMTRQAERRLLLDEPRSRRRWRTIRLFAQVGASAAVLVACVLVGYQAFKPPAAAPASRVPAEGVSVAQRLLSADKMRPELGQEAVATVAADVKPKGERPGVEVVENRKLAVESNELAGKQADATAVAKDVAAGRAIVATAEPQSTSGAPAPATAAPPPGAPPADSLFAFHLVESDRESEAVDLPAAAADVVAPVGAAVAAREPAITIQVAPSTEAQYRAALATLASWDRSAAGYGYRNVLEPKQVAEERGALRAGVDRVLARNAGEAPVAEAPGIRRVHQVPATEFGGRLAELQRVAPDRVRVELSFAPEDSARVVELLSAAAARGPAGAGGMAHGGGPAERPPDATAAVERVPASPAAPQVTEAAGRREMGVAAAPEVGDRAGEKGRAVVQPQAASAPVERSAAARLRAIDERGDVLTEVAEPEPRAAVMVRQFFMWVGDRLFGDAEGAAPRSGRLAATQPAEGGIAVRVIILPPPRAPASAPAGPGASQPASRPAGAP